MLGRSGRTDGGGHGGRTVVGRMAGGHGGRTDGRGHSGRMVW